MDRRKHQPPGILYIVHYLHNDLFLFNFSFKMKEIFRKSDEEKQEKKGPAQLVSFLNLVCYYIFQF